MTASYISLQMVDFSNVKIHVLGLCVRPMVFKASLEITGPKYVNEVTCSSSYLLTSISLCLEV